MSLDITDQYLGLAEDSYKKAISPMTYFSEDLNEPRKKRFGNHCLFTIVPLLHQCLSGTS